MKLIWYNNPCMANNKKMRNLNKIGFNNRKIQIFSLAVIPRMEKEKDDDKI